MNRILFTLRAGNFLRILLASHVIASAIVILAKPNTVSTVLSFAMATVVAFITALVIGRRVAVVLKGWELAALRAAREDFHAPMRSTVPSAWVGLRDALEVSRDRLAGSLGRAQEEKAVLLSMLNAMTEGVIAIDNETKIIMANRVALSTLGVPATQSPEEFAGQHLVKLVRDPRFNELVDRVLATGRPMRDETEFHATRKVCFVSVAPVIENGKLRGVVAAISDNTTLKKLERVRQDFVTNVSHELKTPIAAIRGWAEMLHAGDFDVPEEMKSPVETIYRQTGRLSVLVDDLITLARVEAIGVEEELHVIDILTVVSELRDANAGRLSEKNVTFDAQLADDARMFRTGNRGIRYIVRNLFDNAVKYTEPGSTVSVVTSKDADGLHQIIEVRDEGPGIERHHLTRIFERFYRVDPGRSRELGGTGLGLSIVKNFATAFGGRVEVESEIGKGTTFRVILPAPTPEELS